MVEEKRLLLCVPIGGINDTFCQVQKCLEYAEKFGRMLIIDSRMSGLMGNFGTFFDFKQDYDHIKTIVGENLLGALKFRSCFPEIYQGVADMSHVTIRKLGKKFVDSRTGLEISFDFTKDYDEELIIHMSGGGGSKSYELLKLLTLSEPVRRIIAEKVESLPAQYIGVHVRNTDNHSGIMPFFKEIYPYVEHKNVLVCSDDANVLACAKSFFQHSSVFTLFDSGRHDRRPLHFGEMYEDDDERFNATVGALTDLIGLGFSEKVFYPRLYGLRPTTLYGQIKFFLKKVLCLADRYPHASGFSELAKFLSENKKIAYELIR